MVSIFTGLGAGFERGSGTTLGSSGLLGSGSIGRNNEQVSLNAATGNLLISQRDEFLVGRGPDAAIGRTYNSMEDVPDGDNNDHWRQSTSRAIHGLTGTLNMTGSTVTRTSGDGSDITYTWNGSAYVATDGSGAYDTLTSASGVWTWTDGDTHFTEKYSAYGTDYWRITELDDTNGNKLSFTYNGANLDRVTTQNGEYEQYSWDGNGNITDIVTHFGAGNATTITRTHYGYTANKLTSVVVDLTPDNTTDNITYTTSYSYDVNGRISVISEADGSSVTVTYDESGRVSTLTQAVSGGTTRVTTFTYDTANRQTTITDALNQKTVLSYDVNGNLTKIVSPASQVQQFTYNANGDILSVDKGNGEVVSYGYDSSGNRTSQRDALGNTVERTYQNGRVLTETHYVVPDPDGAGAGTAATPQTTRYVYDATTLNLLYSVSAEGAVTAYGYDSYGNQTSAIEYEGAKYDTSTLSATQVPTATALASWITGGAVNQSAARRTETTYDARGNVLATRGFSKLLSNGQFDTSSTKSETLYTYSQHGDLLTRLVSTGGQTKIESYTYDGLSRIKTTSDNDGVETSVVFADASRTTTVTLVSGATQVSVYDLAGELISYTESGSGAATATSTYQYDALGQLKRKVDALGQSTYFFYDGAGRKTAEVDALGAVTEYRYDAQNDVTSTTRYATRLSSAQLESLVDSGNPTAVTLDSLRPGASADDQWTFNIYDLAQRLVQTIDGTGATTVYAYDGLSQLVSTTQYAGKVSAANIAALKASETGANLAPADLSLWKKGNVTVGSAGTINGANAYQVTQSSVGAYSTLEFTAPLVALNQPVTFTVALMGTSAANSVTVRLYGPSTGWGDNADSSYEIVSGPGTIVSLGGATAGVTVSGLSTSVATIVRITRIFRSPETQMKPTFSLASPIVPGTLSSIILAAPTLVGHLALHTPSYLPTADADNDRVSRMFYDKDGHVTGTLDAEGYLTKIIYDAGGLKTQTIAYATVTTPSLRAAGTFAQLLTSVGSTTSATSTYKYDALGQLKRKVDALGQSTYFFYDGAGRKTAEVDALGAVTEYRYDAQNDVTSTTRYATRLSSAQLASLVDGSGNPTTVTLDSLRPGASADDQWTFNIYDLAERLVQTIDGTGATTVYAYDGLSQLVSTTQYAGKVSAANITALKASETGANLAPADLSLWKKGNVTVGSAGTINGANAYEVTQSSVGAYSTLEFTAPLVALNQPVTFTVALMGTSAANSVTVRLYGPSTGWGDNADSSYEIVSGPGTIVSLGGATAGVTVSGLSTSVATIVRITRIFRSPETQMKPTFSLASPIVPGTLSSIILAAPTLVGHLALHTPSYLPTADADNDRVSRMFYDKDGHVTGTLDAEGYLTQSFYDAAGHKVHTIAYAKQTDASPSGLRATGTFADLLTNIGANPTTGASSNTNDIHHWMLYDARGLLAAAIDGEGDLTRYSYTGQGYLAQQISGQQLDTATLIATPPTLATLPAAAGTTVLDTVSYTYTASGQVQSQTRTLSTNPPTATTTSYTYDQRGNLLSTTSQSGTPDPHVFSQRYDALGRVTSALNAEGNAALAALGNSPTQAQIDTIYTTYGTTYTYDADSRLIATTEPRGAGASAARTLNYYNADGRLAYTIDPLGQVKEYRYNALGERTDTILYAKRIIPATLAGMTGGAASSVASTIAALATSGVDSAVHVDYNVDGTVKDSIDALGATTSYYYDAFGDLTSEVDPLDVGATVQTTKTYDRRGLLKTSVVDSASGGKAIATSYGYDAFGRVLTLTDPANQITTKTYDRAGRLATSEDALGHITTYSYDGRGNLAAVQDALTNVTRYVYDNADRLIYTVDALGGITQNSYDNEGRVILRRAYATAIPAGSLGNLAPVASTSDIAALVVAASGKDEITHSVYDRDGKLRYSVDAGNFLTEYDYDATGNAIRSVAYSVAISPSSTYTVAGIQAQINAMSSAAIAASPVTRNVYNAGNQRSFTIDALGYVTAYTYDAQGNVVKQQHVAAPYTSAGDPTDAAMATWLAANGNATNDRISRAIYDQDGRLRFDVDAESYVTQYTYNAAGSVRTTIRYADRYTVTDSTTLAAALTLVGTTPGTAAVTEFKYDSAGRLTETIDPAGVRTVLTLNQLGQALSTAVAYGTSDASVTTHTYDVLGRVLTETRADGQPEATTTTYQYDALGNLLKVTDAYGTSDASVTAHTYDALGRVLTETRADGRPEATMRTFTYDTLGDLWKVTEEATGAVTTRLYDALGHLTTETDALGGSTIRQYDALGRVVMLTDALGNVSYSYYDKLDRVTMTRDAENYITETSYTAFGDIASVTRRYARTTDSASTLVLPTYSPDSDKDATTGFEYDKLGRVTKSIDALGYYERYTYTAFGERASVVNKLASVAGAGDPALYTTNYTYDKRGLLKAETRPISSVKSDGTVQATTITNRYEYDARGNRKSMVEADGLTEARTTTYVYDKLDRLTETRNIVDSSTYSGAVEISEHVQYDARGNVIQKTDANGARTLFYYDKLDRVTVQIGATGTYSTITYTNVSGVGTKQVSRVYATQLTSLPTTAGGTPPAAPAGTYRETTSNYDKLGRLSSTVVENVRTGSWVGGAYVTSSTTTVTVSYQYDAAGNVIKTIDGNGGVVWSWYDKLGRKTAQLDQGNYLTTWQLDAEGNALIERRYATRVTEAVTTVSAASVLPTGADRVTNFSYDRNGQRLTEARANVVAYTVAASNGALSPANGTMTAPVGVDATIRYTYNALGEVLSKTEANDNTSTNSTPTISYKYDSGGRLITESRIGYADYTSTASTPVIDTPTIRYFYNGLGDLTRVEQGGAAASSGDRTTRYSYGAGGRLTTMIDAGGNAHNYYYDSVGRKIGEAYDRVTSGGTTLHEGIAYQYDAAGNLVSRAYSTVNPTTGVFTAAGEVTTFAYNAYGEVTSRSLKGLPSATLVVQEQYRYDNAGHLEASNVGDGVWRYYIYDANGNRTAELDDEGKAGVNLVNQTLSTVLGIATNSNATTIGAAYIDGINATVTVYDGRNQATSQIQTRRQLSGTATTNATTVDLTTARTYNAFGETLTETDALNHVTSYSYNTMGRTTSVQHAQVSYENTDLSTTLITPTDTYYYDRSGRLVGQMDANGKTTSRLLLAGIGYGQTTALVVKEFHADNGVVTNGYDVFGDLRKVTDEISRVTSNLYDGLGQLTQVTHANGLVDYYTYDLLGQRLTNSNSFLGSGNVEKTDYDIQGRVTSHIAFGGDVTTISYVWNSTLVTTGMNGGVGFGGYSQTITYANTKTIIEASDGFGHVISHTDMGGRTNNISYDTAGRLVARSLDSTVYSYLNIGLVSQVTVGVTGNPANQDIYDDIRTTYTYDKLGEKLTEASVRETGRMVTTTSGDPYDGYYSETDYVSSATTLQNATAAYDALGRMINWSELGTALSGTSGATLPAASTSWTYDAASNVRHVHASFHALDQNGAATSYVSTQDNWYLYDSMNRVVTSGGVVIGGQIKRGYQGTDLAYDMAGERMIATSTLRGSAQVWDPDGYDPNAYGGWGGNTGAYSRVDYDYDHRENYTYDASGAITTLRVAEGGYTDNGDLTVSPTPPPVTGALKAAYQYDAMGRLVLEMDYLGDGSVYAGPNYNYFYNVPATSIAAYHFNAYDSSGHVTSSIDIQRKGNDTIQVDTTNAYGSGVTYALGAVVSSSTNNFKNGTFQYTASTTTTYGWYDSAVLQQVDYTPNISQSGTIFHTWYTNSLNGVFQSAQVNDGRPRSIAVTNDVLGQAIKRDESSNSTTGNPHDIWYRFNGKVIGNVGNNGTENGNYTNSIAIRSQTPGTGAFRGGSSYSSQYANFDQNYTAINAYGQGSVGSTYTVRTGDSLSSIAAQLWGDANLWYKLAEANGLSSNSALSAGQTLLVPAGVNSIHNSASTFKPYDASDAYGDTSPTTPKPQAAAKKNKCGVLGQILLVVVAVAVTIWASPASLGSMSFMEGLLAGAAGSVASQAVGLATGIQQKFDFKGLALSAIAGGVSGGISEIAGGSGSLSGVGKFLSAGGFVNGVARGVVSSTLTQGIAVATGLQSKFNWTGVAAAGIAGGVGSAVGQTLRIQPLTPGNLSLGNIAGNVLTGAAAGIANVATRSVIDGTDFGDNIMAALPDVIGNTIGSLVAGGVASAGKSKATGKPIDLLPEGMYDTTPDPVVAPGSQTAAVSGPAATDADALPGDIVVTGMRDAVYRTWLDSTQLFPVHQSSAARGPKSFSYGDVNIRVFPSNSAEIFPVIRKPGQTFEDASRAAMKKNNLDVVINGALFETDDSMGYYTGSLLDPKDITTIGEVVAGGVTVAGRSSPDTFYFEKYLNAQGGAGFWFGQGDPQVGQGQALVAGFGGGIPLVINGLAYGTGNLYEGPANSISGAPLTGPPGKYSQYLVQRNNAGFADFVAKYEIGGDYGTGKTIVAYDSLNGNFAVAVQADGAGNGRSFSQIRDFFIRSGYNNVLAFDGSSSATLLTKQGFSASPNDRKNNAIGTGIGIRSTAPPPPPPVQKKAT